jgi:hypothetical protein
MTKVSVFQVSIELAAVPELKTTWQAPGLGDVRQPTLAEMFDTPAATLLEQFSDEKGFDYAVVDLGRGDEWLSSRLFVFAEMLPRLRGLRCFVFVETAGTTSRRLVGMARPEAVHWALAQQYPWLELALERAYAISGHAIYNYKFWQISGLQPKDQDRLDPQPPPPAPAEWYRQVISSAGAVGAGFAQEIGRTFLKEIQVEIGKENPVPQFPSPPSPTEPTQPVTNCQPGWVRVPDRNFCERGEWLNGDSVRRLLSTSLQQDAWVKDDPRAPEEEQVRAVLRRKGDFVAIVFEDRTFSRLVDRHLLLEEFMAHELRQQST